LPYTLAVLPKEALAFVLRKAYRNSRCTMPDNISQVTGNQNVNLQDIHGKVSLTINNINTTPELPAEVKEKKEALKSQLQSLFEALEALPTPSFPEAAPLAAPEEKKLKRLIQAVKADSCVLFVGPEVAVFAEGKPSLHELKLKEIAEENGGENPYLAEEGFFETKDDELELDIYDFYQDEFPERNQVGEATLSSLLALPFSLVINLTPDETAHQILQQYDKEHTFEFYQSAGFPDVKPEKEKPLVLNLLGSVVSSGGNYIFTQADFYKYIKQAKIPNQAKQKIQSAKHLLFVGFNFQLWYTRLLLFMLELNTESSGKSRTHVGDVSDENILHFLEKQFAITSVHFEYITFAERLAYLAQEAEIAQPLPTFFVQKQLLTLQELAAKISDAEKLQELLDLESQLAKIQQKITRYAD